MRHIVKILFALIFLSSPSYASSVNTTITGTANNIAGYNGSGSFCDVTAGTGITISGCSISATGGGGGGVSLSGNNTWTGENLFSKGRPWVDVRAYGAVGDGITDDSAAFAAAVSALTTPNGSGTIYVPPSNGVYCLKSGVNVPYSNRLVGASVGNSALDACGTDTTVVTLNGTNATIENISIYGKGFNNDTGTFGATQSALVIGTLCVTCTVKHTHVYGGYYAIQENGNDSLIDDTLATISYGPALVYINTGMWMVRDKFDLSTPRATPGGALTINNWVASHAYSTLGTVVTTGGYNIQLITIGTSGASAPTLKNYGINITDGTAVWQYVSPAQYYGVQIDTGASEVTATQVDISGLYTENLAITNTLAGTAPSIIRFSHAVIGNGYIMGIYAHDGKTFTCMDCEIGSALISNGEGISFQGNWIGDGHILGGVIIGNPTGIELGAGTNNSVEGVSIFGSSGTAVNVDPGVSNAIIANNFLGSQSGYGSNSIAVRVQTGASDYYNITNNIFHGATTGISDNGTGTHKTITGNQ